MNIQKSFKGDTSISGTLYVVPTPIGNLEDITIRALHTLKSVQLIAAEDTRNTKKLLDHFEIETSMLSYHEHNKRAREEQLVERLQKGESIAVVSDAGMPAVSDPGFEIVQAAIENDLDVVVLPGANAALCALVGSGLETSEFYFYGFLPRKKKEKTTELERLKTIPATLLFYESPYRVKDTLKELEETLGNRQATLARELTKRFEEYTRGSLHEIHEQVTAHPVKGECCIVVEGGSEEDQETIWWGSLSVMEHVTHYIEQDSMTSKQAIKQTAVDRNMPKREVYEVYHIKGKES